MSSKKPMVLVLAGPNGSGKSTLTAYFEKIGEYTNADDIVASTGMDNIQAAALVDSRRYAAISEGRDFTFETVLSSEYKLNILKAAKDAGYFVKCIFVLTSDPSVNITRVRTRVAQGGHAVEEEKIISRYKKSLDNIKELIQICDILHVYDNTISPVRIVRKHKDDLRIMANEIWTEEQIRNLLS